LTKVLAFPISYRKAAPKVTTTKKLKAMKVFTYHGRPPIASLVLVVLAVWATAPSDRIGASASACFESQGLAETTMNSYSCGQQYSHTCYICMENYDGEGAEVATCALDYEICYEGVCGIIFSSAVWKAALSLQSVGLDVQFTSGLEGDLPAIPSMEIFAI
jgi:hypothetical protein